MNKRDLNGFDRANNIHGGLSEEAIIAGYWLTEFGLTAQFDSWLFARIVRPDLTDPMTGW